MDRPIAYTIGPPLPDNGIIPDWGIFKDDSERVSIAFINERNTTLIQ